MIHYTDELNADSSSIDRPGNEWDQSTIPSIAIIQAIAEATERDTADVAGLHHSIDPETLDALLTREAQYGAHLHVSFIHDGVGVSVGSDGELSVRADGMAYDPTTEPETKSDLETALGELLWEASGNGVSVAGGYGIHNGPGLPDWDIHITNVERPMDDDV